MTPGPSLRVKENVLEEVIVITFSRTSALRRKAPEINGRNGKRVENLQGLVGLYLTGVLESHGRSWSQSNV